MRLRCLQKKDWTTTKRLHIVHTGLSAYVTDQQGTNFVTSIPYQARYSHEIVCIVGLTSSFVTKVFYYSVTFVGEIRP
jgi:hypothetical protein